ncbi:MAG: hypothetical protein ACYDD1_13000 [Caulobacteraceae bacterium]
MLYIGHVKAAAREHISDHYRTAGSFRKRSMDAKLFADGGRTYTTFWGADLSIGQ